MPLLEEIRGLNELDREELIARAQALGAGPSSIGDVFPTGETLRLMIAEKLIEQQVEDPAFTGTAAATIGGEYFAEAVAIHRHGVELWREAIKLEGDGHNDLAGDQRRLARDHFEAARSAAAIASAGLSAGVADAIGAVLRGEGV